MPNAVHSFFADIVPASTVSRTNLSSPIALKRFLKFKASSRVHASGSAVCNQRHAKLMNRERVQRA